jgi:Zinc knuckle
MNRYRTAPAFGPPKASAATTCQKCLKTGHYSYECKATLQDRPYTSRPSRSQQFQNPKLAPKLSSTKPNELLETKGVADKILADAEAKRNQDNRRSPSPMRPTPSPSKQRSRSPSSAASVSTISTTRSSSRGPDKARRGRHSSPEGRNGRRRSDSMSRMRGRKRRYDSLSASASSRSPSPYHRSRPKNRRHRLDSPDDRGRPMPRRGSHRTPSRSPSLDKSQVTRHRRSLDTPSRDRNGRPGIENDQRGRDSRKPPPVRKMERSLSPYSRRLALTQAMNMSQ